MKPSGCIIHVRKSRRHISSRSDIGVDFLKFLLEFFAHAIRFFRLEHDTLFERKLPEPRIDYHRKRHTHSPRHFPGFVAHILVHLHADDSFHITEVYTTVELRQEGRDYSVLSNSGEDGGEDSGDDDHDFYI